MEEYEASILESVRGHEFREDTRNDLGEEG
jgi:hypothetical protein